MPSSPRKRQKTVATTEHPITIKTILEKKLVSLLPADTPDSFWHEKCWGCFQREGGKGNAHKCSAVGEDVVKCSFCPRVYHETKQCLGGSFFPLSKFEMKWEGETEWACPECVTYSQNTAKESARGDAAIDRIVEAKLRDPSQFLFCIISKGRAKNVPIVHKLFDGTNLLPTWIVGAGEAKAYSEQGAASGCVFEGGGLCASRNKAIDLAAKAKKICVQLSDDIERMWFANDKRDFNQFTEAAEWPKVEQSEANKRATAAAKCDLNPLKAAQLVDGVMKLNNAKLGGVYPLKNEGFAQRMKPCTSYHFIVGDFIVIDAANTPARFDEEMTLKEDYDYTATHLQLHGRVCRVNRLFMKVAHYTNEGGAVAIRNATAEQFNIKLLRRKWPGVFWDQRRKNEVIMRWDHHKPQA
jgi:hypothetical protein